MKTPTRPEQGSDHPAIRHVNEAAFESGEAANLIATLRAEGHVLLSLVAESEGQIVGHILFSRMWVDTAKGRVPAVALAPLAVLPTYQRQGIGNRLVRNGLDRLRGLDERIVIVVGHPDYYPRFGFSSATAYGIEGPFSDEAFMALELVPGALAGIRGRVSYPPPFRIE
jgi:putative acetyltransferase